MQRVTKETLRALKKVLGNTEIKVPVGDKTARVNIGVLADMAMRQLSHEKPPERRFRFVNAGEVTIWQKQMCLASGLAPAGGGARLVWVAESDALDLGVEVKKEDRKS